MLKTWWRVVVVSVLISSLTCSLREKFRTFSKRISEDKVSKNAYNPNFYEKFQAENLDLQLSSQDEELIERMASDTTFTAIEANGRRLLAVIYIQDTGSFEMLDLFTNFLLSAFKNAPDFTKKKLLVASLDESCVLLARRIGTSNIIRIYNSTINMASSFKFRLVLVVISSAH